jgi:Ca-activated chloride channel family protein
MDILWPASLFFLLLIPALVGVYIWLLRRRRKYALRFSSLSLVRAALPRRSHVRRHVPLAVFLLAVASLVLAVSRPVTVVSVPTDQTTILLVMDVSGSMRSADIAPTRLDAAESAALDFIRGQKAKTQIGIVAFSNWAELIQPPTTDQEALQTAINSLMVGRGTAIGSGILEAIDAIAEVDPNVAPSSQNSPADSQPVPVPKGAYAPDIIVLLTDGVSNAGPAPLDAAQEAVDRGLRIYTVGFGTDSGFVTFGGPGDMFGGAGGRNNPFGQQGGRRVRTAIDEDTLKAIASISGGDYHYATSASELQTVFRNLPTYLITKHEVTEISVFFTAAGALLTVLAAALSLLWNPLP